MADTARDIAMRDWQALESYLQGDSRVDGWRSEWRKSFESTLPKTKYMATDSPREKDNVLRTSLPGCPDVKIEKSNKTRIPIVPIGPSIAYIPLTKDRFSLIDRDDVEQLGKHNWHATKNSSSHCFYAFMRTKRKDGKSSLLGMHKLLMPPPVGMLVDHISGDGLDNRRSNLRLATPTQNATNSRMPSTNTSGIKGIAWDKRKNAWYATLTVEGKQYRLGGFDSAQEAHEAYKAATAKHYGEFRRLA